jgi:protocatechuate 3,4-dioxygenase beta subunit
MKRLNRRQALAGFGSLSFGAVLAACGGDQATPSPTATVTEELDAAARCEVTPELTEGPYYFDAEALRDDLREGKPGIDLKLVLRVRTAADCTPIANAVVDLWHCDGAGAYSGFENAEGERFLRGTQPTNAEGVAEFTTVYPGWYPGRTTHIHAKVHLDNRTVLTTQLFFEEAVTEQVYGVEPYASHSGRDVFNDNDGIFDPSLVLTVKRDGDGYRGLMTFDVSA